MISSGLIAPEVIHEAGRRREAERRSEGMLRLTSHRLRMEDQSRRHHLEPRVSSSRRDTCNVKGGVFAVN